MNERFTIMHGDCLERLRELADNSVDAIVTDPPYGLSFMGRKWDYEVPGEAIWRECLRVLKPGGHLLAFAGTRTQHRMAVRIEDAGFEIRDLIAWVYGSGFPKSLDVSKALDKAAGAEREVLGANPTFRPNTRENGTEGFRDRRTEASITAPATDAARQWQGWGTALKPALEPITVARKPLIGTVAENVLAHGTGAINVDGCRVEAPGEDCARKPAVVDDTAAGFGKWLAMGGLGHEAGRWPANLIHDGSDEVVDCFPGEAGAASAVRGTEDSAASVGRVTGERDRVPGAFHADTGSAARFFYCAKASKADRDEGCSSLPVVESVFPGANSFNEQWQRVRADGSVIPALKARNYHPTVKPTDLMRYLCRLVTPPGGLVLDPFMGSGSTGKAAMLEGFRFVGIEREAEYLPIAQARIAQAMANVYSGAPASKPAPPKEWLDVQPDLFAA